MLRRIPLLVAWIGAVLAAPIQAAERVEADFVMTTSSGLVLVRTGKGAEVVALERGATLAGISSPQELRSGDRVRFSPVREARGVRFATSLELLPSIATAPELSVTPGEILALLAPRQDAAGRATLVDLRSAAAFERGHLPGAISAPDWRTRLASTLPADREAPLVLYGASRQDAASVEALRAALAPRLPERPPLRRRIPRVGGGEPRDLRPGARSRAAPRIRAAGGRRCPPGGRGWPRLARRGASSVAPAALHPRGWNDSPPDAAARPGGARRRRPGARRAGGEAPALAAQLGEPSRGHDPDPRGRVRGVGGGGRRRRDAARLARRGAVHPAPRRDLRRRLHAALARGRSSRERRCCSTCGPRPARSGRRGRATSRSPSCPSASPSCRAIARSWCSARAGSRLASRRRCWRGPASTRRFVRLPAPQQP